MTQWKRLGEILPQWGHFATLLMDVDSSVNHSILWQLEQTYPAPPRSINPPHNSQGLCFFFLGIFLRPIIISPIYEAVGWLPLMNNPHMVNEGTHIFEGFVALWAFNWIHYPHHPLVLDTLLASWLPKNTVPCKSAFWTPSLIGCLLFEGVFLGATLLRLLSLFPIFNHFLFI